MQPMTDDEIRAVAGGMSSATPEQARWLAERVASLINLRDALDLIPGVLEEGQRTGRDPKELWKDLYGPT